MKLLLLLAFAGLAASASLRPSELKASTPRELRYRYDAQIATGIEEVSNAFSTLRMRFDVVMRTDGAIDAETGAEKWSLVFKEVSIRQRNNATEQLPKKMLPMEQFRNLENADLWYQMERTLKKPFAVQIRPKELSIAKVHFSEEDPFWSVNIKKGFLSLLQVNFIPREASSDTMEKGQWTKETDEMTVAATCKTFYSVNKIEYHESDSPVYRVDKAIDFNNCQNPIDGTWGLPGIWNGLRHVRMLPGEEDKNLIDVNNMAQYLIDMGGDQKTPIVKKASAKTVHMMVPYSDSTHGSEKIFTVQKLRLLTNETLEESTPIDVSGLTEQPEGIRLIFPEEGKNVDRDALKAKIVELFRKLFPTTSEDIDMKVFETIVRIMRFHLKKEEDLTSIAEELATLGEKHLKVFILDICPQIGTHGSVKFLMQVVKMLVKIDTPKEYVTRAKIGVYHISVIFTKLSMMGKVQLKMLKTVFDVVKDESFRSKLMTPERMPIYSTAWLSMGAMVNIYYGRQGGVEPYMTPIKENPDIVRKYRYSPWELRQSHAGDSEEFRRLFVEKVKEALQMNDFARNLALKVTKNCGLFELYEQLAPLIRKRDTTKVAERVQAIYATQSMLRRNTLVRITAQDPRSVSQEEKYIRDSSEYRRHFEKISSQIQADLITCFRNVREDPEVRIACYRVLMQCQNLKQTVLNMLVQSIMTEPTQQVYTYCVQHMDQIAENPLPRYTRVSQTVRSVLSMLKRREPLDLIYSRVFHGQLWDELHQMGLTIETDLIVSDKSFTPRWTHIRIEHQGMGLNLPLLEIGLRTQGLQGVLEKVLGPRGLLSKAGGVMKLLKRATRSLDAASMDSELLQIVPRILADVPNMDLCVSIMGYDVIYVKNTREIVDSVKQMDGKAILKSLASVGTFLKPFTGMFTISSNYELPTPAGTILDFNCLMNINFQPRIQANLEVDDNQFSMSPNIFVPLTINSFKRIGSNMHVLNHFHQWVTTIEANKGVCYTFSLNIDKTNPSRIAINFILGAPGQKVSLVEFENSAYSTISESHFAGSSLTISSLEKVIKHRKVAEQRFLDNTPFFSNFLTPFGYKVQVQGKYYSTRHLYEAPCSLFMGPSEYTVSMVPTIENEEDRVVHLIANAEIIYPTEESKKAPQFKLQINIGLFNDRDGSATIKQKLITASFTPKTSDADKIEFEWTLRWFLNLPSSYRTSGYELKGLGKIELPEDLKMKPKSLPLQSEEWYVERELSITHKISDESGEVATIEITKSTNPELKKLLVDTDLTEEDMKKTFPLLAACLNESKQSIKEEPLNANPLYTPSCVRQFRRFNKLSQTKIEIVPKAKWFMNPTSSPVLDQIYRKVSYYLQPYLVSSELTPKTSDSNKITIVSRPSPVDLRVHHLNVTCPTRKNVWRSIQLPSEPFFWSGVDPLVTVAKDYAKGGASKCTLLNSHIRTFDNVIYSIPKSLFSSIAENKCPLLLAKDCSEKKEFQVLTHIKDGKKYITIQFNTESKPFIVEVSKQISGEQPKATLKVNGAELEHSVEPKEETEIMKRTINTEKGPVTIVITKYHYAGTIMYKIKSIQHQVSILVGGKKLRRVELRVSPFYHNKVCGLCGDYNGEKFQEFKAPNYHQVMNSPKMMVQNYVLPISDSCKMAQETEETESNPETSQYLPNNIWYHSFDLPKRRPTCQIVDNKRVKTFRHAEFKMMSPALKQIIRDTDCAVKLAVAKIDEERIRVYLLPSQSKILIQVGSFKQQLSISSPASNELSGEELPSGLTATVEANTDAVKCDIKKGDKRVTVKVTSDKRIVIKADKISESEEAICELSHPSQIETEGNQVYDVLKKFTNAEESSVCKDQLKKKINQCQVSSDKVLPFYRAQDYNRRQVRFLNDDLKSRLADTKAPIVLSVDQIGEESSTAYSVQLVHQRQGDKVEKQVLLKKNRQTLVKVTVPETGAARVTCTKDATEHTIVPSSSTPSTMDIDGGFALKVESERVLVSHKKNLYELEIELNGEEPKISIVRPYAHSAYRSAGLCQVNRLQDAQSFGSNPQAVLAAVTESCLSALDSSAPVLNDEEVGRMNRLVGEFNDIMMS